jgi:hypothetical protein
VEELGTFCALAFIKSANVKRLHLLNVTLWKEKGMIKGVLFSLSPLGHQHYNKQVFEELFLSDLLESWFIKEFLSFLLSKSIECSLQ